MDEINVYPNKTHVCPALWDGWDCWPATQATETARRICPKHSYTGESIACVSALWDGWDCWPATQATETARRICPKHSYTGESIACVCKSNNSLNRNQTKASIKAIAVLIPLFGLPLLITSQTSLIAEKSCLAGNIYFIFAYSVEALQGIIIALLFCYLSKEIHQEFRKSYRKCVIGINERLGTNFKVPSQPAITSMISVKNSGFNPTSSNRRYSNKLQFTLGK
ncbi:hypothetical protein QE152_g21568 [Popillia japonica]|uniref:G-protein coupled receptors family 2 profile 1 domain-containing protein n=1 Tax=Popillia japonica TaxID=7064 RepID=A0AAW1KNS5_POPJA